MPVTRLIDGLGMFLGVPVRTPWFAYSDSWLPKHSNKNKDILKILSFSGTSRETWDIYSVNKGRTTGKRSGT